MDPIAGLVSPALGMPCWLVRHGHGSFVAMEFGEPRVQISGPLAMLNGQILTGVSIEPSSRTRFTFDLGCMLSTYPAPRGTYGAEPARQWKWYTRTGPVLAIRDDGAYAISGPQARPGGHQRLPITTDVHVTAS